MGMLTVLPRHPRWTLRALLGGERKGKIRKGEKERGREEKRG